MPTITIPSFLASPSPGALSADYWFPNCIVIWLLRSFIVVNCSGRCSPLSIQSKVDYWMLSQEMSDVQCNCYEQSQPTPRYHNTSMFVWIEKEKSVLLILKEQLYSLAHVIITLAPITQFSNRKRHSSLLAFLYPELTTQVLDFILSYRLFQWIYWILEQRTLSNLSPMTLKITLKD